MTDFNEIIDRTGTFSTQWDYVQDRFGVAGLLPFTISDTDFKLPAETITVLEKAVRKGVFGYTRWNHHAFKSSVTHWFQTRFKAATQEDWIVYSPSVIYSLSALLPIVSSTQDKVMTFTPCYDAFFATIRDNDRELVEFPLTDTDHRYTIDFEKLEKAFQSERITIFLLCSPHNPTGRVWTQAELAKLTALCAEYQVFLISDEIHMDIVRAGQKHIPITEFCEEMHANIALLSSSSKTFNTPALICSYALIPDEAVRDAFLQTLKQKNGLSSISYLGMLAQIDCYQNQAAWVDELCKHIDQEMLYLKQEINALDGFSFIIPEASYLAWIHVDPQLYPMASLQEQLINIGKVAIMRGDTYGADGAAYLRMNIGTNHAKIADGIARIRQAISSN